MNEERVEEGENSHELGLRPKILGAHLQGLQIKE